MLMGTMGFLQTAKFYFKTFLASTIFFGCAIYGVFVSIIFTLIGKQHLAQWAVARAFYFTFSKLLSIEIKVKNEKRLLSNLPGILVGNHQSTLDILILGRIFPQGCTVTAKRSLLYIPFLGWFMILSGTFFLDRSSKEKSIKTLNKALADLKTNKRSLWMFPEGTRSYSSEISLGPFKKGAFHLAVGAQLPVLPVVVSNTSNLVNFKAKVFKSGTITIDCLEPIDTTGLEKKDVTDLTEKVRDAMLASVESLGYSDDYSVPPNDNTTKIDASSSDSTGNETSSLLDNRG